MLVLKNITKIYSRKQSSNDVVALDNVSLVLPEKGFVAILGASGSGKTTLLNIIGGLDQPTSGNMIVDGLSTSVFTNKDWDSYRNQKIGFVLQNCYLLPHLSVRDNVAVKLQINRLKKNKIDELVKSAIEEVGLSDKMNDKPKTLSGGQKQRVAIARAIVGNPTVILADEPTGALDSHTGTAIMELLKKLSKDHLVVMVTHNNNYASKYADRIIELQDGKIINDSNPIEEAKVKEVKPLEKVAIPTKTSFKWGLKNLIVKKYSTLSIVIAASLGLAGVGIILSISSGVKDAFKEAEASAFSKYPVTISSYSYSSPQGSASYYDKYPDEQEIYPDYSSYSKEEHYNHMSERFLTYMGAMPEFYYYVTLQNSYTSFPSYTIVKEGVYKRISSPNSLFYKGVDNVKYLSEQYDCLVGEYPIHKNQLALVVDEYNRVDVTFLYTLGFNVNTQEISDVPMSFSEIIGKKYHYISNDDYYYLDEDAGYFKPYSKTAKQFYEGNHFELEIAGILRKKRDSSNGLFRNGVIYSTEFEEYVISNAKASQIVQKQIEWGYTKDATTGEEIVDIQSYSTNYSKEYQLEEILFNLGSYERIRALYYYTTDYASRVNITNYFNNYFPDDSVDVTSLNIEDYLEHATQQFDGALSLMTSVLYVFAVVAVIISAILNAILTYISIHQRTNEIGLLRSLGARKKDIAIMVETESLLSGLVGGFVSILVSALLIAPLNKMVTSAIYKYNFYLLSNTTFDLGSFKWWVAPILIGLALITALVSALIPSIIASKKDPAKAINE